MAHRPFGNRTLHLFTKANRPPIERFILDGEACIRVPLTRGKWAIVLEESCDLVAHDVWTFNEGGYAFRTGRASEPRYVWMHRLIAGTPENMVTDHINGDKLDNRISNLRRATVSQNGINKPLMAGPRRSNKSGVAGISRHNPSGKWTVRICVDKKPVYLGVYSDLEDAIRVRKEAEAKYYQGFSPRV